MWHSVSPTVVESLEYWTPASLKTLALKTTTFTGIGTSQALQNLLEQLSIKIWQHNTKLILRRVAIESDVSFGDIPGVCDSALYC